MSSPNPPGAVAVGPVAVTVRGRGRGLEDQVDVARLRIRAEQGLPRAAAAHAALGKAEGGLRDGYEGPHLVSRTFTEVLPKRSSFSICYSQSVIPSLHST